MDNEAFVQFMHRLFGIGIVAHATSIWVRCKRANLFKELPLRGRASLHLMLAVAWTQVGLGITTLLHMVPVSLGAMHQGGALTLFTVLITAVHALRRIRF